tara:strand:- start:712 stop:873 length:162 start_codon:yes stop_codon:yes gene_type:complete
MGYDYYTACEIVVTKAEAVAEIKEHGLNPFDFFREIGEHDEYEGETVLTWLGY